MHSNILNLYVTAVHLITHLIVTNWVFICDIHLSLLLNKPSLISLYKCDCMPNLNDTNLSQCYRLVVKHEKKSI